MIQISRCSLNSQACCRTRVNFYTKYIYSLNCALLASIILVKKSLGYAKAQSCRSLYLGLLFSFFSFHDFFNHLDDCLKLLPSDIVHVYFYDIAEINKNTSLTNALTSRLGANAPTQGGVSNNIANAMKNSNTSSKKSSKNNSTSSTSS